MRFDREKHETPPFQPFEHYAIDSDPRLSYDDRVHPTRVELPDGVLNALAPLRTDATDIPARFYGRPLSHSSSMSPRLTSLTNWFRRIYAEPTAIWWAAGQEGLHPSISDVVTFALNQSGPEADPEIRRAWRYLIESWRSPPDDDYSSLFNLKAAIDKEGWTPLHIRGYADLSRPYLKATRPFGQWNLDGKRPKKFTRSTLITVDVRYPQKHEKIDVPDQQLAHVLPLFRKNLEHAVDLEHEISSGVSLHLAPIEPDATLVGSSSDREFGINTGISEFVELFQRYIVYDPNAARRELDAWRCDDQVFDVLRVWVAGLPGFLDGKGALKILTSLSSASFWASRSQRGLLLTLQKQWNTIPKASRAALEKRIIDGPASIPGLSKLKNRQLRAWSVLQTVTWLQRAGCAFQAEYGGKLKRLAALVPEWTPDAAESAANSREGRGGWLTVQHPIDGSDEISLDGLLEWARQGAARPWGELREVDPLGGLAKHRPVRLLAALWQATSRGDDTAAVWAAFLLDITRRSDKPRLAFLIARRLASLPSGTLSSILNAACYWVDSASIILYAQDQKSVEILIGKLIDLFPSVSPEQSARGGWRDWVTDALNSPPGHLSEAVFNHPATKELRDGASLPDWLKLVGSKLLGCPGEFGRFALALFAQRLGWLHHFGPDWSETFITSALGQDEASRDAMLAGFFLSPRVFSERLYMILKPTLLGLAAREITSQSYSSEGLGTFCMRGWLANKSTNSDWLSSDEFRRVIVDGSQTFKTNVLWQAGHLEYPSKLSFFKEIWPLDLAAKTSPVINRLCVLLFDKTENFREFAEVILPFLTSIDSKNFILPLFSEKTNRIIDNYPELVLQILIRTLSDNAATWPYGVSQALHRIVQANALLSDDARMVRLLGSWDRR